MGLFRYVNAVWREITSMCAIRDRSVVRSSVMPSAKYCWSGSLLRLVKGSTTIDRRGAMSGCTIEFAAAAVATEVGDAVAWSAGFPARQEKTSAGKTHHARHMTTNATAAAAPTRAAQRRLNARNPGRARTARP